MGCASSKRVDAAIDVYRPAPASFAVFDINAIEEPWLTVDNTEEQQQNEKPAHVPAPILEKLNTFELAADGPHTWNEVSKVLEDLKPTLHNNPLPPAATAAAAPKSNPVDRQPAVDSRQFPNKQNRRKSKSFHTLEELDANLSSNSTELKKPESTEFKKPALKKTELKKSELRVGVTPATESTTTTTTTEVVVKPVRENIFIVRDKLEREREGKEAIYEKMMSKRDPLSDYPEKCPPGGSDSVIIYTTSLGGVRRTYEDCNRARSILEFHRVVFDERDVSLHSGFLNELKELLGEGAHVPRLFIKGRYVGGVEEVVELNESGRLGRMLNSARVERGVGRQACEGCGGARFVPCLECGGSCKVVVGDKKERCGKCNENGLVHCPACI